MWLPGTGDSYNIGDSEILAIDIHIEPIVSSNQLLPLLLLPLLPGISIMPPSMPTSILYLTLNLRPGLGIIGYFGGLPRGAVEREGLGLGWDEIFQGGDCCGDGVGESAGGDV